MTLGRGEDTFQEDLFDFVFNLGLIAQHGDAPLLDEKYLHRFDFRLYWGVTKVVVVQIWSVTFNSHLTAIVVSIWFHQFREKYTSFAIIIDMASELNPLLTRSLPKFQQDLIRYGHMKLRTLISRANLGLSASIPVCYQTSAVSSPSVSFLSSFWRRCLGQFVDTAPTTKTQLPTDLKIIFPTVRKSLEYSLGADTTTKH